MSDEPLVPVPIPALIPLLLNQEREKGSDLTEDEVLAIRDQANCIMLPITARDNLEEERGYADIDPEYAWQQWLEVKAVLAEEG